MEGSIERGGVSGVSPPTRGLAVRRELPQRGLGRSPPSGIGAEQSSGDWGGALQQRLGRSPPAGNGAEPRPKMHLAIFEP